MQQIVTAERYRFVAPRRGRLRSRLLRLRPPRYLRESPGNFTASCRGTKHPRVGNSTASPQETHGHAEGADAIRSCLPQRVVHREENRSPSRILNGVAAANQDAVT